MKQKNILLLSFILFSFSPLFSQQLNFPLINDYNNDISRSLYFPRNSFHTAVKPWLTSEVNKEINIDSVKNQNNYRSNFKRKACNGIFNKVFNESLISLDKEGLKLLINPVFNFELGNDLNDSSSNKFVNTRGFQVEGSIENKFSFFTTFYENQATFIDYLDNSIKHNIVVPGQGQIKEFKGDGFDYAWASGYISYTPTKYVNLQFGHGKNFIGDGYRSLLLSDNAFNYPYFKITTNVWRLKYVNLYAQFQDLKTPHAYDLGYKKKYGTFHYLSYAITRRLNVGLFEAIIWKAADSTGYRGFDVNYLNPIIFFRPVEFSLGSPDNALLGLNVSYKIRRSNVIYGQLMIDEFKIHEVLSDSGWWGNKQAEQIGLKSFDIFGIKNLYFQTEYNIVRPYTYSSRTSLQNYGHYNEALAHPLGANFRESVTFLKYNYKRFFAELKFNYAVYGADSAGVNYGKDIFESYETHPHEYGNFIGQGIKTKLMYKDFRISYLVNPVTNLNISIGVSDRTESSSVADKHSTFVYFGLRTSLNNFYYDF
ncbi:MAG TPA: hypothetical protein PKK00_09890 [Bacteroidales bacterium]|nr:hypothetical protein [Bacteroidales bacterium]HPS17669.1 hypothetical protein [Bacteroidales bacterium]